ncbi:MAG: flagellar hook-length control protein FliK [Kiritimatiellae bacterium]|nr:flagellar hook-length control protein FliK [Kiritimatiellia bacterium]
MADVSFPEKLLQRLVSLSKESVLAAATREIVDTILVSPGLLRSDGEIRIQLRPDVLEGTAIRLVSSGETLNVQFDASGEKIAALLERNAPQLVERLSYVLHSRRVVVDVRRRTKGDSV